MTTTVIGYNPTSKLLAQTLGVERNLLNADIAIVYGLKKKERQLLGDGVYGKIINNRQAIINASDKLLAFRLLREAGVPVPNWNESIEGLRLPVLGRKIKHTQGKDIVFIGNESEIGMNPPRDFYVEFMSIDKEYRYHVVGDKVIPTLKYDGQTEGKGGYCRNSKTGWKMTTCRPRRSVTRIALAAVKALGLDFGAVDIIESDGEIYVLEVNTAPALIDVRATQYAETLEGMMEIGQQLTLF